MCVYVCVCVYWDGVLEAWACLQAENRSLVWKGRGPGEGEEGCSHSAQAEGDVEKCKAEVENKTFSEEQAEVGP